MSVPKKRIAHLILQLDIGGLERVMLNCIKQMQTTHSEYEHIIISLTNANQFSQEDLIKPVQVYCMNKQSGNDWGLHIKLFKLLRSLNLDILHSYNLSTIEYQFVAMLAGINTRIHAEHGRDIGDPEGKNTKHNVLRKLMSFCIHKYIAVSKELYHWLIDTVNIRSGKVVLITNGINTDTFNLPKSHSDTLRFINIARLSPIKDHQNLLMACKKIHERLESRQLWDMTIVGDGPLRHELQSYVDNNGLANHVFFLGARDDIADLLSHGDVFVLSSMAEGIPMTILEAMSASTPVISTAVGGIPQVLTNEVDGFLVTKQNSQKLAAAMEFYIDNRDCVVNHGKAARQKILSCFDEQKMVQSYVDCYQNKLQKDSA